MALRDTSGDHVVDGHAEAGVVAGALLTKSYLADPALEARADISMVPEAQPLVWPTYSSRAIAILASRIKHMPGGILQFKGNTDKRGINGHLHGVHHFYSAFSGICVVWKDKKGKLYIADGHQRLDRAHALVNDSDGNPIEFNCIVLEEKNGWDAKTARLFAAYKNVAEDGPTTSAMDVARLLRQADPRPDENFLKRWLPTNNRALHDGIFLSRLGDAAFKMMESPSARPSWGAYVAQRMPIAGNMRNPEEAAEVQAVLVQTLIECKPTSDAEMASIVDMAIEAGYTKVEQQDLFGKKDILQSLIPQRVRIHRETQLGIERDLRTIRSLVASPERRRKLKVGAEKAELMAEVENLTWAGIVLKREANITGDIGAALTKLALPLKTGEMPLDKAVDAMMGALAHRVTSFKQEHPTAAAEEEARRAMVKDHGTKAAAAMVPTRDMLAGNLGTPEAEQGPALF